MLNELTIRDGQAADVTSCSALDLSYETEYVWQVDVRDEAGAIVTSFRTARLPRVMHVINNRPPTTLGQATDPAFLFCVAETLAGVHGYLIMRIDDAHNSGWVVEMGVGKAWRRQQVGSALLRHAYRRAQAEGLLRLTIETHTKNYPGICFCQKNGLVFCGFNDRYYPNHDIALFFSQNIRP